MVTKTATVSLHGNTFQVDRTLVGRKVELVFSPFDMETVEVRYHEHSHGKALPHNIYPPHSPESPTRDTRARPRGAPTGIDYLELTAARPPRSWSAPTGGSATTPSSDGQDERRRGQIPGQLSLDDLDDVASRDGTKRRMSIERLQSH